MTRTTVRARLVSAGPLARRLAPRRRFETNAGGSWAVVAKTTVTAALTADFPDEGSPLSTRRWCFLIGPRLNSPRHTGATAAGTSADRGTVGHDERALPRCRGRPAPHTRCRRRGPTFAEDGVQSPRRPSALATPVGRPSTQRLRHRHVPTFRVAGHDATHPNGRAPPRVHWPATAEGRTLRSGWRPRHGPPDGRGSVAIQPYAPATSSWSNCAGR